MTLFWIIILGWLAFAVLVAVFCLWRTRTPGLRVLIGFLAIHVIIAAIAGGMTSRQSALPAVPAAVLTAWGFVRSRSGSRRWRERRPEPWSAGRRRRSACSC